MGIRWPEVITNTELWEATGEEKPTILQIKMRKWRWIGHTLKKADKSTEKQEVDWNPQGTRRISASI
jgi:hypothetical protein